MWRKIDLKHLFSFFGSGGGEHYALTMTHNLVRLTKSE